MENKRVMAHLLLIDDDLALTPEQVRQAFSASAHTVAVACTAPRASNTSVPGHRM